MIGVVIEGVTRLSGTGGIDANATINLIKHECCHNINFSDGNVNGFILFAQIIATYDLNVNNIIPFPPSY